MRSAETIQMYYLPKRIHAKRELENSYGNAALRNNIVEFANTNTRIFCSNKVIQTYTYLLQFAHSIYSNPDRITK